MDNVRKETHVVSVMTDKYKETCTVRERSAQKHQATEMEALQTQGAKFRAVTKIVQTRHVNSGIFLCVKTTSLRLDANLEKHGSSDMLRLRKSPARNQRKVVRKDQLHY